MTTYPAVPYTLKQDAIMLYPDLFEPRSIKLKDGTDTKPAYRVQFVMRADGPDFQEIKKTCVKLAQDAFPGVDLRAAGDIWPWKSGDRLIAKRVEVLKAKDKKYDGRMDFMKGCAVVAASAGPKYPPLLSILEGGVLQEDVRNSATAVRKFYSGCIGAAVFNIKAYRVTERNFGVKAYLNQVLSRNKGERLTFQQSAAEAFSGYMGSVKDVDPTGGAGLDDEIPF